MDSPGPIDRDPQAGRVSGGIWASQTPPACWAAQARVRFGDQPVPRINRKTLRRLRGRVLGASACGPHHPLVGWIFQLPGSPPALAGRQSSMRGRALRFSLAGQPRS